MSKDLISCPATVALALVAILLIVCPSEAGAESSDARGIKPTFETIYRPVCNDNFRNDAFETCWFADVTHRQ